MSMTTERRIEKPCIVGLGKLGSPFAAALACKGFEVTGVDVVESTIESLTRGCAPVFEPGLQDMLDRGRDRLHVTRNYAEALERSDAAFIIVPTPSEADGSFSLRYMLPACEEIGKSLARMDRYFVVVITSTVLPGATGGTILQVLEKASGKRCGHDFGLCYSPEFIALGSVIHNFLNPDFVLIGEQDERAGRVLEDFYKRACENDPPVNRMSLVNAELTKISLNAYVTTKITFANQLARLCEHIPGADSDVITNALGLDSRIGRRYLRGAIGFGGPCFPRDNRAFMHVAQGNQAVAPLAGAVDAVNSSQLDALYEIVTTYAPRGGRVAIAGLSYKPDTDVTEESHAVGLADRLVRQGYEVSVHDPQALRSARVLLGERVRYCTSVEDAARDCDVLVVATAWSVYRNLDPGVLGKRDTRIAVIDCWRILDESTWSEVALYRALGRYLGPRQEA
ncbi:MAG: nucleotide sugar dehydrogenase [Pseudomonadota bacterium]